jgi:hypothetical protein
MFGGAAQNFGLLRELDFLDQKSAILERDASAEV